MSRRLTCIAVALVATSCVGGQTGDPAHRLSLPHDGGRPQDAEPPRAPADGLGTLVWDDFVGVLEDTDATSWDALGLELQPPVGVSLRVVGMPGECVDDCMRSLPVTWKLYLGELVLRGSGTAEVQGEDASVARLVGRVEQTSLQLQLDFSAEAVQAQLSREGGDAVAIELKRK